MANGNGSNKSNSSSIINIAVAIVALIVGSFLTYAGIQASFVPKDQYRVDQNRLEGKMDKQTDILMEIMKKLGG